MATEKAAVTTGPMRAWEVEEGGATYWIAARDVCEATRAYLACLKEQGIPPEEVDDGFSVAPVPEARLDEITVRLDVADGGTKTMREVLALTTTTGVMSCSEWP